MKSTVISLFDYSGNWCRPYRDAGYNVVQIDIKLGQDILTHDFSQYTNVSHIFAAPPCTDFANSGARWFRDKDLRGVTESSIRLVERTLEIIEFFNPKCWSLENPVGRIATLVPSLGKPKLIFHPYEYGDPYRKRTCLWGVFNIPEKKVVEPLGVRVGQPDEWYSKVGGKSEKTKEYRSITPMGFCNAFYLANK